MTPLELINAFIDKYLEGDINRLITFQLTNLRNDDVFGCPNRMFDSADTEIMRAIYCVVFGNAWKNISMDNIGDEKLRGDTINSYKDLFSQNWKEHFIDIWHPDEELIVKIQNFQNLCHTIGNMTILPNRKIGEWSLNNHRDRHDEWRGYEDRFLAALYKVLTNQADCDPDLEELVQVNDEYFKPFYGEEGWRRFISENMLEYYVDANYIPIITSKGYTYCRGGYTNKYRFFEECNRYIDFSLYIIKNRANRIITAIQNQLSSTKSISIFSTHKTVCVVMDLDSNPNIFLQEDYNKDFDCRWHLPYSSSMTEESKPDSVTRSLMEVTRMNLKDFYKIGEYENNTDAYLFIRLRKSFKNIDGSNWFPYNKIPNIPDDHKVILDDALKFYASSIKIRKVLLPFEKASLKANSSKGNESLMISNQEKNSPTKKGLTKNTRFLLSKNSQAFLKILKIVFPDACIGEPVNWGWDKINTKEENRSRIICEMKLLKKSDPSLFVKWDLKDNVMGVKMQVKMSNYIVSLRRSVLRNGSLHA